MQLPKLKQPALQRQTLEVFGGYNHNLRIPDGDFFHMENLSAANYPVLSPRQPRGVYEPEQGITQPRAMIRNHGLCYVDGRDFVAGCGVRLKDFLDDTLPKHLVNMGGYVIILPDNKWVNLVKLEKHYGTEETDYCGSIETTPLQEYGINITFSLCYEDGTAYEQTPQTREPASPAAGQIWLDSTEGGSVLRQWSESTGMWNVVTTTYVKIQLVGIQWKPDLQLGDSVRFEVSGLRKDIALISPLGKVVDRDYSQDTLVGSWVVHGVGDGYIVVAGIIKEPITRRFNITLQRDMPKMDLVIEAGNRLWGCRYGSSKGSATGQAKELVNEIYCSKLGDFKNWHSFRGISTDSYVASIGADGPFTGAVCYQGRPVFFKEDAMIEIFGSYPAEFRVQTTPCEGVQAGCQNSLAIVDNILYYKSRWGVCAFDGSLPVQIGKAFGQLRYQNAVAGSRGDLYYLSMQQADTGQYALFVYDTQRGLWHREDDLAVTGFCSYQNELYAMEASGNRILTMGGSGTPAEDQVRWLAQTGPMCLTLPQRKYVSQLLLRLSVGERSQVQLRVSYDDTGTWEHLYTLGPTGLQSVYIPICPRRCDHIRLQLEGVGPAKVYSLTKTIEQGSDRG